MPSPKAVPKPPRTDVLSVRLPVDLADWLRIEAARERRTIGAHLSMLLEEIQRKTPVKDHA